VIDEYLQTLAGPEAVDEREPVLARRDGHTAATSLALAAAVVLATLGLVGVSACSRGTPERLQVAATVFPVYDITRRLAEDRLDVHLILTPGLDAHSYDPRPQEVAALADSSLIFAVGLGLDDWAHDLAQSAGAGAARVFEMGPLMDPILAPPGLIRSEPLIDAHFWLDPLRARRAVDVIVEALGGLDPVGGPFYRSRGEELKRSFQGVHEEIAGRAERWSRRRIVTFHGSLFYFASRYDLEVAGVVEPVPGQEPTGQHLARLIDLLRAEEPAILFAEPQMDDVLARALAREAGVVAHEVDPMGGRPGTDSYEALMRRLSAVMDEALR
jgi:ABC-type Zn uptake system ZnuABC Zn-binding protein ZnuA